MCATVIRRDSYALTDHRVLCRRGVIWLGQTCNLKCYFCYFADRVASASHPEHPFMSLDKAKGICRTLVEVYGNNSVDIQGGEPTIYPHIYDLLAYCNEIGLKPTLITNAVALSHHDRCRRLRAAGVFDLLISIHGLGEVYDSIVRVKGASERQLKALDKCSEEGVPFRINITLTKEALSQIDEVVALVVEKGARAVNFIAFNPFIDQSKDEKRNRESIPLYRDTVSRLLPLIDLLEESHIEANVRYLPFCIFPDKYRKYVQNFQQIVYDLHEWESASEVWSGAASQRQAREPLSEPLDFFSVVQERRAAFIAAQGRAGRLRARFREAVTVPNSRSMARSSRHAFARRTAPQIESSQYEGMRHWFRQGFLPA
jgi:sulfatase maturation enzyme AslB (radical SAM superfamily)